ncbi:hypothetical protein [Pseudoxanthomonas dokdonensis]|uniref:Serine/threonine protein kinase n=1 Tax=Pseudoxanthomonas dokdonensis TaxID=344882 RepID=A0A0R0CER2_9GAMM|nr:hypothetical protein [Pseudoxanthomonas dokdonensis]KRG68207.1 hypothetical protein ABB29_14280 [Pseudoxanthomonas dokdonensis]
MELDDFKASWQTLGQQLQQQNAINLELLRETKLHRARSSLRPLFWGQCLQILLGIGMLVLGVSCWSAHADVPHLLVAGIILHIYGILAIALGGMTMALGRVDPSLPVLLLQKKLAQLSRMYAIGGMWLGASWCLLWIPFFMALAALVGVDIYAHRPGVVGWAVAIGIPALLLTWAIQRRAQMARQRGPGQTPDIPLAGASIIRANQALDELARFERD